MKLSCTAVRDALPLFVYADLPPVEMGRLGMHIGGCESCSGEHSILRALLHRVDAYVPRTQGVDVDAVLARAGGVPAAEVGRPAVPAAHRRPGGSQGTAVLMLALLAVFTGLVWRANQRASDADRPQRSDPSRSVTPPDAQTPPDATMVVPSPPTAAAPWTPSPPDLRQARHLLTIYQADPDRDPQVLRRRLREASVDAESFLFDMVRGAPTAAAGTALEVLIGIDRTQGLEAAGVALRHRDDLDARACELLGASGSSRAVDLLDQGWKPGAEVEIATGLAQLGSRRAARTLARRIEQAEHVSPQIWGAFCSMDAAAAEPAYELIASLPKELRPRAVELVATATNQTSHRRLRELLDDPALALLAAARLAERGDPVGLDPLLRAATESQFDPADRTLATEAMASLARSNPAVLAERLHAKAGDTPANRTATIRALIEGAPEHVAGVVSQLAREKSLARCALEVARLAGSAEAAGALLPLGRSRQHAAGAVAIAAALPPEDARRVLIAFLATRYGAAPAREYLTSQQTTSVSMPPAEPE